MKYAARAVTYATLPPGEYKFRVATCNEDGFWNPDDTAIAFSIPPFLWEQAWFAPVCWLGGMLALTGLIVLQVRRRARRRLEKVERQRMLEHERARISKDLHDDLGGYAAEFLNRAGLRLRLDVQKNLPDLELNSERRHSLFLAAKESLTNVVRHAAATEVVLRLHTRDRRLLLTVEDSGKGFEPPCAGNAASPAGPKAAPA